jgi:hypothetical protein
MHSIFPPSLDTGRDIDRIVVTLGKPFDAKNKKSNSVLADVRGEDDIRKLITSLDLDEDSGKGSWMSPAEIYLNFMLGKSVVLNVGVVENVWLRCETLESDCCLNHENLFHEWLISHGIAFYEHRA